MNRQTRRDVIATLLKAGRRDLAVIASANYVEVTHQNFDEVLEHVVVGRTVFYIVSLTKPIVIHGKEIDKAEKAGYQLISKANDGRGFRMQSGKKTVYIPAGALLEMNPGALRK